MQIPKPVGIAVATVIGVVLLGGMWLKSGQEAAGRKDPEERVSAEQKMDRERADAEERIRRDGPPRD